MWSVSHLSVLFAIYLNHEKFLILSLYRSITVVERYSSVWSTHTCEILSLALHILSSLMFIYFIYCRYKSTVIKLITFHIAHNSCQLLSVYVFVFISKMFKNAGLNKAHILCYIHCLSSEMLRYYHQLGATITYFHNIFNSIFTTHPTIWCYAVSAIRSIT